MAAFLSPGEVAESMLSQCTGRCGIGLFASRCRSATVECHSNRSSGSVRSVFGVSRDSILTTVPCSSVFGARSASRHGPWLRKHSGGAVRYFVRRKALVDA